MSKEEFGDLFFVVRDVRQKVFELLDIAIHIPGRGFGSVLRTAV
jgi:hypothetical protein